MLEVKISQEKLKAAYRDANLDGKRLLESMYDKTQLVDIEEELDTIAKCEASVGRYIQDIFTDDFLKKGRSFVLACAELEIIAEAYNGGIIDFSDQTQPLWFPWVNRVSGCGLSLYVVYCNDSITNVAPRLCFKTKELAEKAFKKFPEVFEAYFKGMAGK